MDDLDIERVLTVVDLIPAGNVVSYGDIGALIGLGPRQVGWVMAHYGAGEPWWRVTNVQGKLGPITRAKVHWLAEGISIGGRGDRCDIGRHHADLELLAQRYEKQMRDRGLASIAS